MVMHIAYHTTDEVNLESATRAARECGAFLSRLPDPVAQTGESFAALLHDLDHVDTQVGRAIVSELRSRPAPLPVAVHGYNLRDEEIAVLHANGVVVSRKFNPELIRALCRASEGPRTPEPDRRNQDSQGVSDDPAVLSAMVRSLASQAYRVLSRSSDGTPHDASHEIGPLRQRVDQLQQHLDQFRRQQQLGLADLQRWLNSLRRRLDSLLSKPRLEVQEQCSLTRPQEPSSSRRQDPSRRGGPQESH
jgi:hypothetical protein